MSMSFPPFAYLLVRFLLRIDGNRNACRMYCACKLHSHLYWHGQSCSSVSSGLRANRRCIHIKSCRHELTCLQRSKSVVCPNARSDPAVCYELTADIFYGGDYLVHAAVSLWNLRG